MTDFHPAAHLSPAILTRWHPCRYGQVVSHADAAASQSAAMPLAGEPGQPAFRQQSTRHPHRSGQEKVTLVRTLSCLCGDDSSCSVPLGGLLAGRRMGGFLAMGEHGSSAGVSVRRMVRLVGKACLRICSDTCDTVAMACGQLKDPNGDRINTTCPSKDRSICVCLRNLSP